jgi:DNA-binding NarL/FixJ family response regulator
MSKSTILWQSNLRNGDFFEDLEARARAYLLKYLDIEALMADIKAVAMGNVIISQAISGRLIDLLRQANEMTGTSEMTDINRTPTLSIRELEVLRHVAGGARNGEIADQLYISEATVKAHLRNIMDKMQVKNRAQAVARAISIGMLEYPRGQPTINNLPYQSPMRPPLTIVK